MTQLVHAIRTIRTIRRKLRRKVVTSRRKLHRKLRLLRKRRISLVSKPLVKYLLFFKYAFTFHLVEQMIRRLISKKLLKSSQRLGYTNSAKDLFRMYSIRNNRKSRKRCNETRQSWLYRCNLKQIFGSIRDKRNDHKIKELGIFVKLTNHTMFQREYLSILRFRLFMPCMELRCAFLDSFYHYDRDSRVLLADCGFFKQNAYSIARNTQEHMKHSN